MRKRHVIQILFYLVFGALVILAMVVSGKLSEEQEAAAEAKAKAEAEEDYTFRISSEVKLK